MTKAEFDLVMKQFPRITDKKRRVARAVLVDGIPQSLVADETKIHRATVSQVVNSIWNAYLLGHDVPADWIVASICLPKDKMAIVLKMEADARNEYAATLREFASRELIRQA